MVKDHSFKLCCVGRTLRNDLEHTHIHVMCMYILELIYVCLCLMFSSPAFSKTFNCSYFHGMRCLPFAFILMVIGIM